MHTLGDTYKLLRFVFEQALPANVSADFCKSDINSQSVLVMTLQADADINGAVKVSHFAYF